MGLVGRVRPGRPADEDPICVAGAPFSVLDYDSVRAARAARSRRRCSAAMPPWLPEPGHGVFADERRLRDDQIALIAKWARQRRARGESGRRAGDRRCSPAAGSSARPISCSRCAEPYVLRPGPRRRLPQLRPAGADHHDPLRARRRVPRRHAAGAAPRGPRRSIVARVSRALDRADAGPGFATMDGGQVQNVYGWTPGKVPVMEPSDTAWTLEPGSRPRPAAPHDRGRTSDTVQPPSVCSSPTRRRRARRSASSSSRRRSTFPPATRTTSSRTATCCRSTSRP